MSKLLESRIHVLILFVFLEPAALLNYFCGAYKI